MSDYVDYFQRKCYEQLVITELLRHHFDVSINLVGDRNISCIIRNEDEDGVHYIDIQIVALIDGSSHSHFGIFADLEIASPRENYYLIFYSMMVNIYWVIPSKDFVTTSEHYKDWKGIWKYRSQFCSVDSENHIFGTKYYLFENAFHLLSGKSKSGRIPEPIPYPGEKRTMNISDVIKITPNIGRSVTMDWDTCLNEMSQLNGQTLMTLKQNKKFTILSVSEKKIKIKVESTGKERLINFEREIYSAYKELIANRQLTRIDIQKYFAPFNPAFVAAILAHLPRVRYIVKPVITIFID